MAAFLGGCVLFSGAAFAAKGAHSEQIDGDKDGFKETVKYYDDAGRLHRTSKDLNKDGKPDHFMLRLEGHSVLREGDRNFDGKIDDRKWQEWGERRLGPGLPTVPGYRTVRKEADNDYDGKIDEYTEKGNKEASKTKIGQPFKTDVSS